MSYAAVRAYQGLTGNGCDTSDGIPSSLEVGSISRFYDFGTWSLADIVDIACRPPPPRRARWDRPATPFLRSQGKSWFWVGNILPTTFTRRPMASERAGKSSPQRLRAIAAGIALCVRLDQEVWLQAAARVLHCVLA